MKNDLLFLFPTNIGDFILATPVLKHLMQQFSDSQAVIYGGKQPLELIEHYPGVRKVIPCENFRGANGKWKLYQELSRKRWKLIADFRKTLLPFFLSADHKLFSFRSGKGHAVSRNLEMLGRFRPEKFPGFLICSKESDRLHVKKLLDQSGFGSRTFLIGLNPDANWIHKRWPAENWNELIRILKNRFPEASFIVTGREKLLEESESARDFSGQLSLRELAELMKMCRVYITNDSGPMHLSCAAGTKTLGIFGPSHPERYAPAGAGSTFYKNTAICRVCQTVKCSRDFWCLKNTFPEKIAEIVISMLST